MHIPPKQVAVVVDSAASLPPQLNLTNFHVVPLQLIINNHSYLDGQDIVPADFYRQLPHIEHSPTTSAPSPEAFFKCFRNASLQGLSILCLTVSNEFSASFNSALTASKQMAIEYPMVCIEVIDSQSAAGGQGLIATEAWRTATSGASLSEVAQTARKTIAKVRLFAFLDTLDYIQKGGRVTKLAYAVISRLNIKPLLEMKPGNVRLISNPVSRVRALRQLLRILRNEARGKSVHVSIMHAACAQDANILMQAVQTDFNCRELFISEFSPVMGAHTGPGTLGIAFWTRDV